MVCVPLEKVTTETSYVSAPPTGIRLIAVERPLTMVVQLPAPMLPELSSMKPSWIVAALAGAGTASETASAAAANKLFKVRCFIAETPHPSKKETPHTCAAFVDTRRCCELSTKLASAHNCVDLRDPAAVSSITGSRGYGKETKDY